MDNILDSPDLYPIGKALLSEKNISYVYEEVKKDLKKKTGKKLKVSRDDISRVMYEVYRHSFGTAQSMTDLVIKTIVDSVIDDEDSNDKSHLNPWIKNYDSTYGISEVDPPKMKIKRKTSMQFDNRGIE